MAKGDGKWRLWQSGSPKATRRARQHTKQLRLVFSCRVIRANYALSRPRYVALAACNGSSNGRADLYRCAFDRCCCGLWHAIRARKNSPPYINFYPSKYRLLLAFYNSRLRSVRYYLGQTCRSSVTIIACTRSHIKGCAVRLATISSPLMFTVATLMNNWAELTCFQQKLNFQQRLDSNL